ncbi:MAG: pyridine nucleotide-disulfide oxidoreductase [Porticoccaceae bacterium]|nr:pyridine nucleotide-disulfide oxidoreductase [Porticoccaceae bacterium]
MKKLILGIFIVALVAAFFFLDLDHWLTLEGVARLQDQMAQWRTGSPVLLSLGFVAFYVIVTALSLPGAAILTLAAGAFFGLVWGAVLASFASSIGATLAFLVSRYLFHDMVQARFGRRLRVINEGVAREGAFYLFSLRLVPVFPFFIINLLMGLTPIRASTFYWVSQLGMFPATLVYVNAGTQLAQIDSLQGLLSPSLILSFTLLGIFPLIARKLVTFLKRRRVYRPWKRPRKFDRNLIVIGAGAAGLVTAYIGATVKARVTLIEAHKMGGDCLNYGCVPSKALIQSARVAETLREADRYGFQSIAPQADFPVLMKRIQQVIKDIEPHDSVERYTGLGVDVVEGHGRLVDPWTVEIRSADGDVRRLTSRAVVIAAGAAPFVPDIPGLDAVGCLTSDTLWDALAERDCAPERLAILGGGPIGCELAQAFARLGIAVTLVELQDRLLLREDEDVAEIARDSLAASGVRVLTGRKALSCRVEDGARQLLVEGQDGQEYIEFDEIICAIGRRARLSGYGLETLGIDIDGKLNTNAYLQTLYPNIYAAGDVAGQYQLTHVAGHEAWYAAVNALFGHLKKFTVDYRVIPAVTFIDPEVARVGLNEREAQDQGRDYRVVRYDLADLDRAIADGQNRGFVKVLTPPRKDTILGATIVGQHGGELLAEFVLAMRKGLGLNDLLSTIHSYPTWSEANKYAAGEWKKANAPVRVLAWLEKYHRWRRGG